MKKVILPLSLFLFFLYSKAQDAGSLSSHRSDELGLPAKKVNESHLQLPSVFNNNMVLQQKTKVLLWGKADSGKVILIHPSWTHKTYATAAGPDGNWKIKVPTPGAGGPYEINFSSEGDSITFRNVLLGEVWLCSGQSNMEMPLKGYRNQPVLHSDSLIADAANHPDIRIYRVPKAPSAVALQDCKGTWYETNPKTAPDFSAVAYQYALLLNEKLHVPVGVIATYWGGTAIQSWMSEKNLHQFPEAWSSNRLDTITNPEKDPERSPSILYNSMIAPISGYTIKGFVWYQGESNRFNPLFYRQLMPAMVKEWRDIWGQGNLPFYYVQIAPYAYSWKNNYFSAILRESQLKAMDIIPNSGMAVCLDVGKERFIHPPDKTTVSQRLSYWALAKTYRQKGVKYLSPVYKKMKVKGDKAIISFDHASHGLTSYGKELSNFEIAGTDSTFYPAQASIIHKNKVVVYSSKVKAPVAVRYAFKNWAIGDLYNKEGLPASSFRTDTFE